MYFITGGYWKDFSAALTSENFYIVYGWIRLIEDILRGDHL